MSKYNLPQQNLPKNFNQEKFSNLNCQQMATITTAALGAAAYGGYKLIKKHHDEKWARPYQEKNGINAKCPVAETSRQICTNYKKYGEPVLDAYNKIAPVVTPIYNAYAKSQGYPELPGHLLDRKEKAFDFLPNNY